LGKGKNVEGEVKKNKTKQENVLSRAGAQRDTLKVGRVIFLILLLIG